MTPQERELVADLFDRLAKLENAPRDPEAERLIVEGLRRAPHAIYSLVQTVLVQEEALKRANAQIQELERELGVEPDRPHEGGGFLDNVRDAIFGSREQPRGGSVPSIPRGDRAMGAPAGFGQGGERPDPWGRGAPQGSPYAGPAQGPYGGAPQGQYGGPAGGIGQGGSFLGTAAAAAAGAIGGSLLMNSFRGMFGNNPAHAAYNPEAGGGGEARTPWGGDQAGGDLSRQAGLDDVGRSSGGNAQGDDSRAGLFDTADNDADFSGDYGDDFDGGDSDLA